MRSAKLIFKLIEALDDDTDCTVGLSVLEIYNEKLNDLLSRGQQGSSMRSSANDSNDEGNKRIKGSALRIRDIAGSTTGGVWVEGLAETAVRSASCFANSLAAAMKKRATGSHSMNASSSRSHMICIVTLRQTKRSLGQRIVSKLHLVDLAGSEMVRRCNKGSTQTRRGSPMRC